MIEDKDIIDAIISTAIRADGTANGLKTVQTTSLRAIIAIKLYEKFDLSIDECFDRTDKFIEEKRNEYRLPKRD